MDCELHLGFRYINNIGMHPELDHRKLNWVDTVEGSSPMSPLSASLYLNKHKVNCKPPLSQFLVDFLSSWWKKHHSD